jgi:hypothetical protein
MILASASPLPIAAPEARAVGVNVDIVNVSTSRFPMVAIVLI